MSRDMVQILSCDKHAAKGEAVTGVAAGEEIDLGPEFSTMIVTVPIGFDGVWKELDWCKPCQDEPISLSALRELWEERGIDVEAPKRRGRPPGHVPKSEGRGPGRPVPESEKDKQCLWCVEKYAADSGYTAHLNTKHGLPKSLVDVFGNQCPLCGDTGLGRLGAHCKSEHNVSHISQAFIRARGNGDQYKVVERVMAKATKTA